MTMFTELFQCLKSTDQWLFLAKMDVKSKYRRTVLGPLWMVIVSFLSIFSFTFMASLLFKLDFVTFAPHVAGGIVAWTFLSMLILESTSLLINNAHLIQNLKVNIFALSLRMFCRSTIIFLHNVVVVLIVFLFIGYPIAFNILFLIPAIIIYAINTVSLSFLFGFFATRFRDFIQIIQSLLGILMFTIPIWWKPSMLGEKEYLVYLSPLYYFVEIIQKPIKGEMPAPFTFMVISIFTLVMAAFASLIYNKFRSRIVFWL